MVDLHLVYGDAAVFLGAETRFSILDALENLHRFDQAFFRSLLVKTAAGPNLLASSDRPVTNVVDSRRLSTVLEFASSQFPYTVVDVPRSDVAVLDAWIPPRRSWWWRTRSWRRSETPAGWRRPCARATRQAKVMTVINRTDRRSEIGQQDIERAVGGAIAHQFPSDYRRALQAMHRAARWCSTTTTTSRPRSRRLRASWPALKQRRGRREVHRLAGAPRRSQIVRTSNQ